MAPILAILLFSMISITPAAAAATVQVNGTSNPVSVAAGATITATVANGPGNSTDWLGVYAVGSQSGPGDPASWKYLSTDSTSGSGSGVTAGTVHLVVPTRAGNYEVRFFPNNGFTVTAAGAEITVSGSVAATVQVNGTSNPVSIAAGATITATVANGPGNSTDWLGVYAVGSQSGPGDPASWKYLSSDSTSGSGSGVTAGTVHLVVPTRAGNYEVRFFPNNGFTVTAASAGITVAGSAAATTVQVNGTRNPVSVAAGAAITATVASGPGNPGDWLGVYAVGSASGSGNLASWKYLSTDSTTGSGSGITAGTVHLVVPVQAGNYEVRFFPNNSFTVAATSAAITVAGSVVGDSTLLPSPPAGFHWVRTFVDDFSTTFANTGTASGPVTLNTTANSGGVWSIDHFCGGSNFTSYHSPTYGCGLSGARASDTVAGGVLTMTLDDSANNERNIIATGPPAGDSSQGNTFTQRFGYFVYQAKLPNCASREWDLEAFAVGSFGASGAGTAQYGEVAWGMMKAECNYQHVYPYEIATYGGSTNWIDGGDIETGIDLTAGFHQYGLLWTNDGSAHGSVVIYFDGNPATRSYALRSVGWDSGLYFDVYWQGPGSVSSQLQLDFVRAYQLAPN